MYSRRKNLYDDEVRKKRNENKSKKKRRSCNALTRENEKKEKPSTKIKCPVGKKRLL